VDPEHVRGSCPAEMGNAPRTLRQAGGKTSISAAATRRVSFSELFAPEWARHVATRLGSGPGSHLLLHDRGCEAAPCALPFRLLPQRALLAE
jgi:hypothetical protein